MATQKYKAHVKTDTGYNELDFGQINVYSHTYNGVEKKHYLGGSGSNIRFFAGASFHEGDTFVVNNVAVTYKTENNCLNNMLFAANTWVTGVLFEDNVLHFTNISVVDYPIERYVNGYIFYEKYASGRMIAKGSKAFTNIPVKTPWGALYDSGSVVLSCDNYVIPFVEIPKSHVYIQETTGYVFEERGGVSATKYNAGNIWLAGAVPLDSVSGMLVWEADGYWKL
jgi:hypothetical protein